MKKRRQSVGLGGWLALALIVGIGIYWSAPDLFRARSVTIPNSSESLMISLFEPESPNVPNSGELIVEKSISDPKVVATVAKSLSQASASSDHKCAAIGSIAFRSGSETVILDVLPGHDSDFYEFRINGSMFRLPRGLYIDALLAAGIDPSDIRLDGHPGIEQAESLKP